MTWWTVLAATIVLAAIGVWVGENPKRRFLWMVAAFVIWLLVAVGCEKL